MGFEADLDDMEMVDMAFFQVTIGFLIPSYFFAKQISWSNPLCKVACALNLQ